MCTGWHGGFIKTGIAVNRGMINKLKKLNRALLELEAGILMYAVLGQLIISFIPGDRIRMTSGWWIGIIMAAFCAWHMWKSLDRALDFSEQDAVKKMRLASILRYVLIFLVTVLTALAGAGNVLTLFFGVMMLKVSAYTQPLTHKIFNKIFREQDSVAQPLPEEEFYEVYPGESKDREKDVKPKEK